MRQSVNHDQVIVPTYFNSSQKNAKEDVIIISCLWILKIKNEPSAATIAYGHNKKKSKKNAIVFDRGDGTFYESLFTFDDGVFEVVATSGDIHLRE